MRFAGLKTATSGVIDEEDVTLNGTTAVTTSSTWYRIFRVRCLTYGSGGTNAGNITVRHSSTTANVFAVAPAGTGRSTIAAFTVPDGKTMLIRRLFIQIVRANGSAGSANVTLRVRPNTQQGAETATGGYEAIRNFDLGTDSPLNLTIIGGLPIDENYDVKIRCESVSDTNTILNALWEYELV